MKIDTGEARATIILRLSVDLEVERRSDAALGHMRCLETGASETFQSLADLPDLIARTCNALHDSGAPKDTMR